MHKFVTSVLRKLASKHILAVENINFTHGYQLCIKHFEMIYRSSNSVLVYGLIEKGNHNTSTDMSMYISSR